jgi:hypothetical protein
MQTFNVRNRVINQRVLGASILAAGTLGLLLLLAPALPADIAEGGVMRVVRFVSADYAGAATASSAGVQEIASMALPDQQLDCPYSYLVRRGDTLSSIARRAGVSTTTLRNCNGLSSSVIIAGTIIRTPRPVADRQPNPTPATSVQRRYDLPTERTAPSEPRFNPYSPTTPRRATPAPSR